MKHLLNTKAIIASRRMALEMEPTVHESIYHDFWSVTEYTARLRAFAEIQGGEQPTTPQELCERERDKEEYLFLNYAMPSASGAIAVAERLKSG